MSYNIAMMELEFPCFIESQEGNYIWKGQSEEPQPYAGSLSKYVDESGLIYRGSVSNDDKVYHTLVKP